MTAPQKTVLITGGNTGLGYHAATELAAAGWQVVIASRNKERTAAAANQIQQSTGNQHVLPMQLDLASLDSVRTFAGEFVARELAPLQAIICNAGITLTEMQSTADGVDKTFQVNHLGHFLLVNLLLEHLQQPGRVVMVSSGTHIPSHKLARATGVTVPKYVNASALAHPEQASPQAKITNPAQAYSTSKLCNLLFAYELSRRLHEQNVDINTYALDPGLMPDTSFAREFPAPVRSMFQSVFIGLEPLIAGVRRGGESGKHLARLVTDPVLDDVTAAYFDGLEQVRSSADSYDEAKARDLWATSAELAQLQPHESILMKVAAV